MLSLQGVTVRFDEQAAVLDVDLSVGPDEVVAVLGPSGCGKSTLLRAIAGLEQLDGGRITWCGRDLDAVPVHRRDFGLMFQDYALFPHRDVRGNVEFGLRMDGRARADRRARVAEVLALVGLDELAERSVATLSGGEQQRVALARALAPSPGLLMLDEPLGALDRDLRERLLAELDDLLAATGVPALYVTHDHEEAFALADRLAVMRDGRLVQVGTTADVWARPADPWVAAFLGFGAAVSARRAGERLDTPWGPLPVRTMPPGEEVRVVVRPDAWRVHAGGALAGRVEHVRFRGAHSTARVRLGDGPTVEMAVPPATRSGAAIQVDVEPDGVLVYDGRAES